MVARAAGPGRGRQIDPCPAPTTVEDGGQAALPVTLLYQPDGAGKAVAGDLETAVGLGALRAVDREQIARARGELHRVVLHAGRHGGTWDRDRAVVVVERTRLGAVFIRPREPEANCRPVARRHRIDVAVLGLDQVRLIRAQIVEILARADLHPLPVELRVFAHLVTPLMLPGRLMPVDICMPRARRGLTLSPCCAISHTAASPRAG